MQQDDLGFSSFEFTPKLMCIDININEKSYSNCMYRSFTTSIRCCCDSNTVAHRPFKMFYTLSVGKFDDFSGLDVPSCDPKFYKYCEAQNYTLI